VLLEPKGDIDVDDEDISSNAASSSRECAISKEADGNPPK
jgi:hypothetical protein